MPLRLRFLLFGLLAALVGVGGTALPAGAEEAAPPPRPEVQRLGLDCVPVTADGARAARCTWRKATHPQAASYKLWRAQVGEARKVVFTTTDLDVTTHTDTTVVPNRQYLYAILAYSSAGRIVGVSLPDAVGLRPEALRLECVASATPSATCTWSDPSVEIDKFVLLRGTWGGRRIFTIDDGAATSYTDSTVRNGVAYAYLVAGLDADGRVVAASLPDWVLVPRAVEAA